MPTFTTTELHPDRSASAELGGKGAEGAIRRYVRTFMVVTDSEKIGPQRVMFAPGIPRLSDFYQVPASGEVDKGALCKKVEPRAIPESRIHWVVTCEYSSDSEEVGNPASELSAGKDASPAGNGTGNKNDRSSEQQSNPLNRPPKVSLTFERFVKPLVRDVSPDRKLAVNSADEPFDPPLEYEDLRPIIRITKNEAIDSFKITGKHNRVGVNNDVVDLGPFGRIKPGGMRQVGIDVTPDFESGVAFVAVTREYIIQENAAFLEVLDMGLREKDPVNGLYFPITRPGTDGVERQINSPVPLRNGQQADEPDVLIFQIYPTFPFARF